MQKTVYGILAVIVMVAIAVVVFYMLNNSPPSPIYYSSKNATNLTNGINNFAFKVYSELNTESNNESTNIFFSPFSVYTAMSMVAVGAGGNTASQIHNVLSLSPNSSDNHAGFGLLFSSINAHGTGYNLSTADSVWVEKNFPINQGFTKNLSVYYFASSYSADFVNDASGEITDINNWVSNKTDSKITGLIPPDGLDSRTVLVLVNAIYFKGKWLQEFNKNITHSEPFYISPYQTTNVSMMYSELNNASYYGNSNYQALEMDYAGGNLSMLILLPNQTSLSQAEADFSPTEINNISSKLVKQKVDVWLPRFNITQSEDMKDLLESLGIQDAFNPNVANFSGISSSEGLSISHVYHKAYIQVNESGTTAAAATGAVAIPAIAVIRPNIPQFDANHPFIFFIIEKHTRTILFMGRLASPNSSK